MRRDHARRGEDALVDGKRGSGLIRFPSLRFAILVALGRVSPHGLKTVLRRTVGYGIVARL